MAFALFTEPYLSMPVNIFARNDVSYIGKLENLANKRVAVVEGYAVTEWLSRDHPEIQQVAVKSAVDALIKTAKYWQIAPSKTISALVLPH